VIKVAVVQLVVRPGHRATTLQGALAAFDRAAEADPAPELILLPAFCDVPELARGESCVGERLEGPTLAAIAHRARQWGVFACFGLVERSASRLAVCSVLVDHDGDFVAVRRGELAGVKQEFSSCASGVDVRNTAIGAIGLLNAGDVCQAAGASDDASGQAELLICPGCFLLAGGKGPARGAELTGKVVATAKRFGAHIAVADVSTEAEGVSSGVPGTSMIVAPDGVIVCGEASEIMYADVPAALSGQKQPIRRM
jgi:predicted amidohydrolase